MTGTITPSGVGTAYTTPKQATAGSGPDMLADPGNTNAPIIFEPPAALSGGGEVWMIATGGNVQVATNAATASGNTLSFAGPLPPAVVAGIIVADLTNPSAIPAGTLVAGTSGSTVTLSGNVAGAVGNGDTIAFYTPNWGGCQVLVSTDGNTNALAGTIYRGGRQGVLTATFPSGSDPDSTDTLAVDLTESQGQLISGTSADADNFVTLCFCDGELVSYETATLTTAYHYSLGTYLRRGVYGTPIGSHASGAQFARFGPTDPSLFRYGYPANLAGTTIYVKLPAFNTYGQVLQSPAACTAYTYTLTGAGGAPVTVPGSYTGPTIPSMVVQRYVFATSVNFPSGFSGSQGRAGTAATATATYAIQKNGSTIGTMVFAASATSATFTMSAATAFAIGDVLTILAPATPDATLAAVFWSLLGTVLLA